MLNQRTDKTIADTSIGDIQTLTDADITIRETAKLGYVPNLMLTHALNTIGMALCLWIYVSPLSAIIWSAVHLLVIYGRSLHQTIWRSRTIDTPSAKKWITEAAIGAFIASFCWASIAIFLFPTDSFIAQVVIIIFLSGLATASTSTLGHNFKMSASYFTPIMVALSARLLIEDDPVYLGMGFGAIALFILQIGTAKKNEAATRNSIELQFANSELLSRLRIEKALTEEALNKVNGNATFLKDILNNISQGVCVFDRDGELSLTTPKGQRILGKNDYEMDNDITYNKIGRAHV